MDAATGNTVLGGNSGVDRSTAQLDNVNTGFQLESNQADISGGNVSDNIIAAVAPSSTSDDLYRNYGAVNLSDMADEHSVKSIRSVELSDGLKAKLDDAEYEAKKTLTIQDDLERHAEEKRQLEIQAKEIELEEIQTKGLSL